MNGKIAALQDKQPKKPTKQRFGAGKLLILCGVIGLGSFIYQDYCEFRDNCNQFSSMVTSKTNESKLAAYAA